MSYYDREKLAELLARQNTLQLTTPDEPFNWNDDLNKRQKDRYLMQADEIIEYFECQRKSAVRYG